jgi:hypothetical protein
MRRIIKVLAAAALIAIILAVGATSALAQRPDWAQPEDPPPKYGWGANPELCKPYSDPGCGFAYGKK